VEFRTLIPTNIIRSFKETGISWYNLQEFLLKEGTFTPFVGLGIPSEGKAPEK
jgi:hypothetical protein